MLLAPFLSSADAKSFFCELVNMSPRQLASTDKNVNEKKIVYKRTRHIDMRIVHTEVPIVRETRSWKRSRIVQALNIS